MYFTLFLNKDDDDDEEEWGEQRRVNDLFSEILHLEEQSVSNIHPAFFGPIAIILTTDFGHLVMGYERGWTQTISHNF